MKVKYFFVYYHAPTNYDGYSHPEIRVFRQDAQYPTCHDGLFSFHTQTDKDHKEPYSLHVEFRVSYHTDEALKLLNKVMADTSFSGGWKQAIKNLRKLGVKRYVLATVNGNGNKEFIPRKYRDNAEWYYTGLTKKLLK